MEEKHRLAVRTDLRLAVAENACAFRYQKITSRDDIRYLIAYMVDTAIGVAFNKFRDRGSIAERLDEFDLGVWQRRKHGDHSMLRQRHGRRNLRTESGA